MAEDSKAVSLFIEFYHEYAIKWSCFTSSNN